MGTNRTLNTSYLIIAMLLLITEVLIAVFLKSGFIRHTFGDYLAVILLYSVFKSFISGNHFRIAVSVLVIAFLIEFLQLINILGILNLEDHYLIKVIVGSTFQLYDLVAYTLGILTVLLIEFKLQNIWTT